MTPLVIVRYYLIIVPHLLLIPLLVGLLRKGLYRPFPVFTTYIANELIQFVVLFWMIRRPSTTADQYLLAFAVCLAISTAFRFGMIQEIISHMSGNYSILKQFGKPIFRWVTVCLLLFGLLLAVYTRGNDADPMVHSVYVLDRAASILQVGLLAVLFFLANSLGLSWRNHVFGIALGLGILASSSLANAAIRSQVSFEWQGYLNYFTMGVYHVCVVLWGFYVWAPERVSQITVKGVPEHDVESWNKELQRLIRQ